LSTSLATPVRELTNYCQNSVLTSVVEGRPRPTSIYRSINDVAWDEIRATCYHNCYVVAFDASTANEDDDMPRASITRCFIDQTVDVLSRTAQVTCY